MPSRLAVDIVGEIGESMFGAVFCASSRGQHVAAKHGREDCLHGYQRAELELKRTHRLLPGWADCLQPSIRYLAGASMLAKCTQFGSLYRPPRPFMKQYWSATTASQPSMYTVL